MRSILLVDDEINVRKGLRALIERADTTFGVIGECENGREALDRLSEERFDLVVADIKMPYMDGLTLIKESQKLAAGPKFIILSGYDDFNYAKTAIRYGVNEYLLKPVDMNEMIEALNKVESELKKEERIAEDINRADTLTNSLIEHELSYIFSRDSLTEQEVTNSIKALNVDIFNHDFYILITCRADKNSVEELDFRRLHLKNRIPDYINDLMLSALTFYDISENLVITLCQKPEYRWLMGYLNDIEDGLVIGISNKGSGIGDLQKCYLQANEALKYRIIRPLGHSIITYEEIEDLKNDVYVSPDSVAKIPQMISACKTEEAKKLIGRLFDVAALNNRHIGYVHGLTEDIYLNAVFPFIQMLPSRSEFFQKKFGLLKNIYNFKHISEYLNMLDEYLSDINNCLMALRDKNTRGNVVDGAITYIHNNYGKDINMAMVANHASVSYSYFSSLFSEQTGLNFAEYLKKVRVEKAKELLSTTDYPVNAVSREVGFKNARHFARVFKDLTGILPMEYRNSILINRQ